MNETITTWDINNSTRDMKWQHVTYSTPVLILYLPTLYIYEFCLRIKLCRKTIERLSTPFGIVIKVNPDAQMNVWFNINSLSTSIYSWQREFAFWINKLVLPCKRIEARIHIFPRLSMAIKHHGKNYNLINL